MSPTALPNSLFISHGAPTLAIDDSSTGRFLDGLGDKIERFKAVLIVSAHDSAEQPRIGSHPAPPTVHDFGGFAAELYTLRYPAPGDPALARRVHEQLHAAGIEAVLDPLRGFDHGIWVPMRRIRPQADLPIVSLSLAAGADAAAHLTMGRALAGLLDDDVLLIGSGGLTHNLGMLDWRARPDSILGPAQHFREALSRAIEGGDFETLVNWETRLPHARQMHPTSEHLMPLFVALGAAGPHPRAERIHSAVEYAALALDAWSFHRGNTSHT